MKKFILISSLMLALVCNIKAQSDKPKDTKKKSTTTSTAIAAKPSTTASAPTKKDGTPDMRYKENKDAAKAQPATVHTKKDGTPDKRYKENKKPS